MAASSAAVSKHSHRAHLEKSYYGYIFIAPFFLAYLIFSLYPLLSTFFFAFTDKHGFGSNFQLIGIENFTTVFGDSMFLNTIWRTPFMWILGFIPQMLLALLLAAWFTDAKIKVKAQGFFKVIFYLPNIMTAATIGGLFFSFIQKGGVIHDFAVTLGILASDKRPLTGPEFSMGLVAFVNFWMWFGNSMIVLIAGILGINPSLFEAASIDGASGGQTFRKITLPLIRPIMTYTLVTSLIGGFQMFDIPQTLSAEGSALGQYIQTIVMYIRKVGMQGSTNMGVASAASVILFVITCIFSIVLFALMKDRSDAKYLKKQKKLAALKGGNK